MHMLPDTLGFILVMDCLHAYAARHSRLYPRHGLSPCICCQTLSALSSSWTVSMHMLPDTLGFILVMDCLHAYAARHSRLYPRHGLSPCICCQTLSALSSVMDCLHAYAARHSRLYPRHGLSPCICYQTLSALSQTNRHRRPVH
ncbi:hypothetical protein BgiBS90_016751 [Biomphalaria glabrata]|nr:hypothetical protein BgiBS90_016751 [Biomphalaria glabrata]